jgi:hypothetical protein
VIDLQHVPVRIVEAVGGVMAEPLLVPADAAPGGFQRRHATRERLRAARPERRMDQLRGVRGSQLQRVALVVVPAAQKHRRAFAAALGHAHYLREEAQAFLGLRDQQLQMAEKSHVHQGFVMHRADLLTGPRVGGWVRTVLSLLVAAALPVVIPAPDNPAARHRSDRNAAAWVLLCRTARRHDGGEFMTQSVYSFGAGRNEGVPIWATCSAARVEISAE